LRVATRIEIAKLNESMPDTTMIYVTHDQVEAMTLADRIVVLRGGYIEQVGSPMELYHRPANLFVAQFIGSPAMNILRHRHRCVRVAAIEVDVGCRLAQGSAWRRREPQGPDGQPRRPSGGSEAGRGRGNA
jgi:alpha-glucoside transport system ATP-binding protein